MVCQLLHIRVLNTLVPKSLEPNKLTTKRMNMFIYSMTIHFIASNEDYYSCPNLYLVYQMCPNWYLLNLKIYKISHHMNQSVLYYY